MYKHQADWAEKIVPPNPPPPSSFCYEWITSATFHCTWTNGKAQTNQLSTELDVNGLGTQWLQR